MNSYIVNHQQRTTFNTDGFVRLPNVIDEEWIIKGREACERATSVKIVPGSEGPDYFMKLRVWENNDVFRHLATLSSIPNIAAQLVRSQKINLLYDQMFNLAPGSEDRTVWHHDLPYWPITGSQVVTIWLAFDPVTEANGALEFIRGSHLWKERFQPIRADDKNNVKPFGASGSSNFVATPDFDAKRKDYDMVLVDLEPGDAVAFHALTVHSSRPNQTKTKERRAYAMRYTGDAVRYKEGPVWNVYIVNPDLHHGDILDSEQYPVVYQSAI